MKDVGLWRASARRFSYIIGLVVVIAGAAGAAAAFLPTGDSANSSAHLETLSDVSVVAVQVDGFRSARFNMNEQAVRKAIVSDFGLSGTDVVESENALERTRVLTVNVPDVLEGGGTANVSYIFGYKSKALIQIGIAWSVGSDPTITDSVLVSTGNLLRSHFLAAGYVPESIVTNTVLDNAILLFKGADASGHSSILLLQGRFETDGNGKRALLPGSLALLYSLNPDDPDVFKIKEGSF